MKFQSLFTSRSKPVWPAGRKKKMFKALFLSIQWKLVGSKTTSDPINFLLNILFTEERKSCWFRTTWRLVNNDRIIIFWVSYPFKSNAVYNIIYEHMLPMSEFGKSSLNDENMKGAMSPRRQQWLTPHPHQPNIQPQTDIHWDRARDWPLSYLTAANSSKRSVSRQAKHSLGPVELQDHLQKCQFAAKYFSIKTSGRKIL